MAPGEMLAGPFSERQTERLDATIAAVTAATGLRFGLYVGDLDEPVRRSAESLQARTAEPELTVLVAVSPNQRVLEIVTGTQARRVLSDRACDLAALSMTSAFAGGDLVGGLVDGITQLADHAGR